MSTAHYRWFIERTDTQQWWTGLEWTSDPHIAKGFSNPTDANDYIEYHNLTTATGCNIVITEHEFSSPLPTPHTQN